MYRKILNKCKDNIFPSDLSVQTRSISLMRDQMLAHAKGALQHVIEIVLSEMDPCVSSLTMIPANHLTLTFKYPLKSFDHAVPLGRVYLRSIHNREFQIFEPYMVGESFNDSAVFFPPADGCARAVLQCLHSKSVVLCKTPRDLISDGAQVSKLGTTSYWTHGTIHSVDDDDFMFTVRSSELCSFSEKGDSGSTVIRCVNNLDGSHSSWAVGVVIGVTRKRGYNECVCTFWDM